MRQTCAGAHQHYHNPSTGENVAVFARSACTDGLGHFHQALKTGQDPERVFDCARVWYDRPDAEAGASGRCGLKTALSRP